MNKTLASLALLGALTLPMASCYTLTHKVGSGGTGSSESAERQWFILFGLVPLNSVDSHAMADGATDYTVVTQQSPLDILINIFTSWVTIMSREVTVTK